MLLDTACSPVGPAVRWNPIKPAAVQTRTNPQAYALILAGSGTAGELPLFSGFQLRNMNKTQDSTGKPEASVIMFPFDLFSGARGGVRPHDHPDSFISGLHARVALSRGKRRRE